jgi:hypothetical protein
MAGKDPSAKTKPMRRPVPSQVALDVLTEAGYRCGVPTCRGIIALDLHHLAPLRDGGPNTVANLIALCPTCHALFERGTIPQSSLVAWKAYLGSLTQAYDHAAIDLLWFLKKHPDFMCSGDGAAVFARLVGSGLAELVVGQNGFGALVGVHLSPKGNRLLDAWVAADIGLIASPPD